MRLQKLAMVWNRRLIFITYEHRTKYFRLDTSEALGYHVGSHCKVGSFASCGVFPVLTVLDVEPQTGFSVRINSLPN